MTPAFRNSDMFRNVDAALTDPVQTWPFEALVEIMERGLITDWRPILDELRREPWGVVARKVERWVAASPDEPAATLFGLDVRRARQCAETEERVEVGRRVRVALKESGLTAAEFAARIGTSASRLSTYVHGRVIPSATMLIRIEARATNSRSPIRQIMYQSSND